VPTVRVTCPECEYTFSVAESRVGGLVNCRDCGIEFRVEFADDEEPQERDERPQGRHPARTKSRVDADSEPETWKSDLPIRSPVPLLLTLAGLQVLVAGILVLNWFLPAGTFSSPTTQNNSYYSYPTSPKSTSSTPTTRKW
jgi:hypothetical protein